MAREVISIPRHLDVDHRNGNKLDFQKLNLRSCTKSQNQHNRRKTKGKTSSRYKGVCFNKVKRKWQASIGLTDIFGRRASRTLGYFKVGEDAAKAYDTAARYYFREFACLNFAEKGEQSCL